MTNPDLTAVLTGTHTIGKDTSGGRERPTRDEIARLAYQFYEQRGKHGGFDVEDWLAAEEQLNRHYQ